MTQVRIDSVIKINTNVSSNYIHITDKIPFSPQQYLLGPSNQYIMLHNSETFYQESKNYLERKITKGVIDRRPRLILSNTSILMPLFKAASNYKIEVSFLKNKRLTWKPLVSISFVSYSNTVPHRRGDYCANYCYHLCYHYH